MGRSAQAERPCGCDRPSVDDAAVLAVLADADAAPELPRLGGLARPDGVAIVSERVWCFSRADVSGLSSGRTPRPPALVARLPLVRGLAKLGVSLAPLVGRRGTVRPLERLVLLAALLAPLPLTLVPNAERTWLLAATVAALLAWMLRGRALRLHGAEHRAIAAAELRCLADTWAGRARPTRFSPRCGTNFAALLVPISLVLDRLWFVPTSTLTPAFVSLAALMLTMEIWIAAQRWLSSVGRVAMLPGLALQRLTTREPELEDTRVALRALAGVLAAER
jgi:Protein of unknown function (DUF1385)